MAPRSKKARMAAKTTKPPVGVEKVALNTPPLRDSSDSDDLLYHGSDVSLENTSIGDKDMNIDLGADITGDIVDNEVQSSQPLGNGYIKEEGNSPSPSPEGDDMDRSCDANIVNVMEVEQEAITVDESFVMSNNSSGTTVDPTPFKAKSLNVMFEGVAEKEKEKEKESMPPPPPPVPSSSTSSANKSNTIQVFLRVRPMTDKTKESTIKILPSTTSSYPVTVRTIPPPGSFSEKQRTSSEGIAGESEGSDHLQTLKEFTYSRVFEPETEQASLYSSAASSLVSGMFDPVKPQSALLFAYGITNAGKSHTIMGTDKEPGIVPRTMKDIFSKMTPTLELHMSYLEIYNEQVYDLLAPVAPIKKGRMPPKRQGLRLQDNKGTIEVRGLSKHKVCNTNEGLKLAATAKKNRQVTGTNLNGVSSRSHSVCQLELVPKNRKSGKNAMFWIVDLAGSERSKRTGVGAKSAQQREASGINTSLMKLWRCLKQLRSNQQQKAAALASNQPVPKAPLVPFRESKLTHLFMNHLSGSAAGRTVMIVNVNPQPDDYDETQHVLNSAAIAQSVKITNEEYVKKKEKSEVAATHDANGRSLKSIAEDASVKERKGHSKRPSGTVSNAAMNNKMQQMANENAALKSALNSLKERLFNAETEIREEVAEEFEERIMEIHEEYAMQKRSQEASRGVPTPARSVRKLQAERANDYVDELLEKIIECEEEMERMRSSHDEELSQRDSIIEDLRKEVERLKEGSAEQNSIVAEGAGVATGIDTDGTVKYDTPVTSEEVDGVMKDEEEEEEEEEEDKGEGDEAGDEKEEKAEGGMEGEKEEVVGQEEEEEEEEEEGEESDGSVMDLIEEDNSTQVASVDDGNTVGAVVAESADTPKADKEEDIAIVEPTNEERKKMDEEAQKRKLKRLPRSRCSEVACVPVKKEKVASPATESADTDKATALPAPTPEPTKKKKGLFAKLTSGKKKRKAEEDISPSGAGTKRKSLGEISNISELTQPTVTGGKQRKLIPRPRGRAPRGKIWDGLGGAWVAKA